MNEPASLLSWLRLMSGSSTSWAPFTLNMSMSLTAIGDAQELTLTWLCWRLPVRSSSLGYIKPVNEVKEAGCLWNPFSSFQLSSCMTVCTLSVPAGVRSCKCWCCSHCVSPCVHVSVLCVCCTCPPVVLAGTLSSFFVSSWQQAALSGWMWVQHRWYIIDYYWYIIYRKPCACTSSPLTSHFCVRKKDQTSSSSRLSAVMRKTHSCCSRYVQVRRFMHVTSIWMHICDHNKGVEIVLDITEPTGWHWWLAAMWVFPKLV